MPAMGMAMGKTATALLTLGLAAASGGADAAQKRPNILFMMADQLRFDAMGTTSRGNIKTPGLDRLAREGARVQYSWTSTPTCTPARAAILTGQSPWRHGLIGAGEVAPVYAFEMPAAMAEAGYSTTSFGKDHFGWNASSNTGIQHGYESLQLFDGLGHCVNKSAPCGTKGAQADPGDHNWNGEFDDYDVWFRSQPGMAGKVRQCTPCLPPRAPAVLQLPAGHRCLCCTFLSLPPPSSPCLPALAGHRRRAAAACRSPVPVLCIAPPPLPPRPFVC
eukprot:SAG22_NODE_970_length_6231_cov_2.345890_6_plen_276_part_00